MVDLNEFDRRARGAEREGLEVTVIGRLGRLGQERQAALAELARCFLEGRGLPVTDEAVAALVGYVESLAEHALGRARASRHDRLTADDLEGAWSELVLSKKK
jgi:hypothetical protein